MTTTDSKTKPTPEAMARLHQDQRVVMLQQIVDQFNKAFEFWQKDSGCVASFQWDYREGKEMQIKAVQALEMAQVDQILYRR